MTTATTLAAILCTPVSARERIVSASRTTAKTAITNELKRGRSERSFVRVKMTESEAERIVSQIERERFRYWRRSPAVYVREWLPDGTWFEGFVVHVKNGKKAMEIDRLIRSKARKIVSKKVRKKMSQRKKAKAIAVGTASALSYKRFGKDVEGSTARNLKKNKGYCMIYALVYQAACDRAGLKCKVAFGTANGEDHAWNQVSIGGKRRYVDACWYDVSNGSGRYVLSSGLWRTHKLNEFGTFYEYK